MKVIIAGSRYVKNFAAVEKAIADSGFEITEVVSGGAVGVDAMGEWWAHEHSKPLRVFPANWSKYGVAAGPIRNQEMAAYGEALIAVWDGQSRGTKNMIDTAKARGLPVHIHLVY